MSRHRGAKRFRRYELLGIISLLSPAYLLSVERWPFHEGPPDHYDRLSSLLDLSVSQSGWLMPLHSNRRFPTVLSQPSRASVTLWEATAPVKLPTIHCLGSRFGNAVRHQEQEGWYFTLRLHSGWRPSFKASHLFYTVYFSCHSEAAVKVHGVFPSNRGYPASSRGIQFR